jgi:hypothetical protein
MKLLAMRKFLKRSDYSPLASLETQRSQRDVFFSLPVRGWQRERSQRLRRRLIFVFGPLRTTALRFTKLFEKQKRNKSFVTSASLE